MAVVSLEKIRVYAPITEAGVLMKILQDAGCLEVVTDAEIASNSKGSEQLEALSVSNQHTRIEMARTFFSAYHQDSFLKSTLEEGRAYTTKEELLNLSESSTILSIIAEVESFQFQLAELERTERTITENLHTLYAWERFELPLNRITETEHTITYALRAPERPLNKTLATIEEAVGNLISIKLVSNTTALITLLKTSQAEIEELISAGGVTIVKLPDTGSTALSEQKRLNEERVALLKKRSALVEVIQTAAAAYLPVLKKMSDITRWDSERAMMVTNLPTTERTIMVTAFAPRYHLAALQAELTTKLPHHAVEVLEIMPDESLPTEIINSNLLKPFETVTRLYGAPAYRDLDPTPVLSLFFFIFFGICLSDAGYGLTLMLLTGLVLWRYHLESSTKQLMTLLFYGGVSTFLAGILFGGYFGIDLPAYVSSYPQLQFLLDWQKFDPINNPLPVFYMALVLGFIQVAFGIFLNLYRKINLGETKAALLDDAPWLYLFALAALYLANMVGYVNSSLGSLLNNHSTIIFGSAVVLLVVTQGRDKESIVGKILFGILGLYNTVGYFADILSYSRLMALGLATGALAFSINSIAGFIGGDSLGVGTIFMIMVLILGHSLNVAISLLGTFINSARLQFVEFFSKFSTGTGRSFVPFRKETRHVIILPDPPSS